ncbi:MAG TPA: PIN domain-containing protein, partial [Verrucomicrobiae bacterium]|nr:PIN domain-containing protein [Verrucomicrobiae bacterium]
MKTFVLDTNVLLYDPNAVSRFQDNCVIIPITVIEEIDRFKKDMTETGRNARQVSRYLDDMRKKGSLAQGIALDSGGTLCVEMYDESIMKTLPPELQEDRGDNRILAV